jgi:hypothetical protein
MRKVYITSDPCEQKALDQAEKMCSFIWDFQQLLRNITKHGGLTPEGKEWDVDSLYQHYNELLQLSNIDIDG